MHMLPLLLAIAFGAPPDDASMLVEPTVGGHPLSARGIAMGGAERAIADGVDAVYLNPAGMGMNRRYTVDAGYSWTQSANSHRPNVAIVDSATTVLSAGVGYSFDARLNSGDFHIHRVNSAVAYTFGSIFGIGATFKYLDATRTKYDEIYDPATNAPRTSIFPYPAQRVRAFTGDLAAMLTPIQYLSIAVIGYNLIPNPVWAELTPIALGMGAALHIAGLHVDVDAVIDFTTRRRAEARMHFGAEYSIVGMIPLRAGFIYDRISSDMFWSLGAGFRHPSFGIDVGYRQAVGRPENRTLSIGVQYYMR